MTRHAGDRASRARVAPTPAVWLFRDERPARWCAVRVAHPGGRIWLACGEWIPSGPVRIVSDPGEVACAACRAVIDAAARDNGTSVAGRECAGAAAERDSRAAIDHGGIPAHVQSWIDFLATVEVRGPIPIAFSILQDQLGVWILRSEMLVPDRDDTTPCERCRRPVADLPVIIQNVLPGPEDDTPRELVIRQRVLGHYQHEALESIHIGGRRPFDPHAARWYSNLVADWRFNR